MKLTVRGLFRLWLLVVFAGLCAGCAASTVSPNEEPPDISKLKIGAFRIQIEKELGEPLTEMRATIASGADMKSTYQYFTRDKISEDAGTLDKVSNFMVGMTKHVVVVFYDRYDRAVKVQFIEEEIE